jgi:hypothetical protein
VHAPVRKDERERGRPRRHARLEVVAKVADVGAAVHIDDHVVAVERGDATQIGHDTEAGRIEPQQAAVGHRDDEQPPIGEPAEARRTSGNFDDRLAATSEIHREHAVVVHVRDPQLPVPPARAFEKSESFSERSEPACHMAGR